MKPAAQGHQVLLMDLQLPMCDAWCGVRSLIKDELEPHMRDFSPSVVNGLFFERLSFGLVPMSIMGVRIVPPQTHSGSNVAIGESAHCTHVLIAISPCNLWCIARGLYLSTDGRLSYL